MQPGCSIRFELYKQINFTYIYLLVYFLTSMSTNKNALKSRNFLIATSSKNMNTHNIFRSEQTIFQILEKQK